MALWNVFTCICVSLFQESEKLADQAGEEKRARVKEHRKTERELQRDGKRPFFLKKCELCAEVHSIACTCVTRV